MKTVILAGGLGTRLAEETDATPKPMVEIGGPPILWHIMKIYARRGLQRVRGGARVQGRGRSRSTSSTTSCTPERRDHRPARRQASRCTTATASRLAGHARSTPGLETKTGGRIKRLADHLRRRDVHADLRRRRRGHRRRRAARVPPRARRLADGHGRAPAGAVRRPRARRRPSWPSSRRSPRSARAGSTAASSSLEPAGARLHRGRRDVLEREPLERLAADGQLAAYRHDGFWQPMDTLRDVRLLNALWDDGDVPWKLW